MGEDVDDELADVVVDPAPGFDRGHDGGEVVVGEHHGGGLAGHVGAGASHGHPDVGAVQCGGVVDAVTRHGDDPAVLPQGVGHLELRLGRGAGEDDLVVAFHEEPVQLVVAQRLRRRDHVQTRYSDADLPGDGRGGGAVVTRDDVYPDPGLVAAAYGLRHLGARRVVQPDEPEQGQPRLRVLTA